MTVTEPEKESNFSTECWFLTVYCHHIALIPVLNKYHRRLRAIRDLQKMVTFLLFDFQLAFII